MFQIFPCQEQYLPNIHADSMTIPSSNTSIKSSMGDFQVHNGEQDDGYALHHVSGLTKPLWNSHLVSRDGFNTFDTHENSYMRLFNLHGTTLAQQPSAGQLENSGTVFSSAGCP
ncbi:hypothetical protein PM082_009361 [Marasmius tenuissimus]|nr:hypothetical protein PM082_009361 [Marasmius tenuissimus]